MRISVNAARDRGIWAIGDVHGCAKTLAALYAKISPRRVYTLGDYVDRGPDSKGVLDFLMAHSNIIPLMGNHEDMMLFNYATPNTPFLKYWLLNSGGEATLKSFGVDDIRSIPRKYIMFMRKMPLVRRFGPNILSHAGADLSKPRPYAVTGDNKEWLLYNRRVKPPKDPEMRIIVGHTPVTLANAHLSIPTRKIMIDGGCAKGGRLIAYNLDTQELVSMKNID